jgi:hypothetical protein
MIASSDDSTIARSSPLNSSSGLNRLAEDINGANT